MEKHLQAFIDACLSQGADLDQLFENKEEHQIFAEDQPFLKNVVNEIFKRGGPYGKAPTTAQSRKLLKDANSHFLGRLTGSCSRTCTYAADATLLHNAWAKKSKSTKQQERRWLNCQSPKPSEPASGSAKKQKKTSSPASGSTKKKHQEPDSGSTGDVTQLVMETKTPVFEN